MVAVAKKYMGRGARLDDLIQEGNLGLLRAIHHFDPERGNRFATYAVWWIRAYMTRYLVTNRFQVRGGRKDRGFAGDLSLEVLVGDEDGSATHLDQLTDKGLGPEGVCLSQDHDARVRLALGQVKKRLGELGWDIVQQRLSQSDPSTLAEIGLRHGVSRERVRQIEVRTKRFLRRYLEPIAA